MAEDAPLLTERGAHRHIAVRGLRPTVGRLASVALNASLRAADPLAATATGRTGGRVRRRRRCTVGPMASKLEPSGKRDPAPAARERLVRCATLLPTVLLVASMIGLACFFRALLAEAASGG